VCVCVCMCSLRVHEETAIEIPAISDMIPCRLKYMYECFGGVYTLHLHRMLKTWRHKAVYTDLHDLYSWNLETYMNAILKASKLAAIIFQYRINWLLCVMGTVVIYYVVGTEILSTGK